MNRKQDKVPGTDHLQSAMNRIAEIEDRGAGRKHCRRLSGVLHRGSLNHIARFNVVMEVTGKLVAVRARSANQTRLAAPISGGAERQDAERLERHECALDGKR
jgi:hypothetical protein